MSHSKKKLIWIIWKGIGEKTTRMTDYDSDNYCDSDGCLIICPTCKEHVEDCKTCECEEGCCLMMCLTEKIYKAAPYYFCCSTEERREEIVALMSHFISEYGMKKMLPIMKDIPILEEVWRTRDITNY